MTSKRKGGRCGKRKDGRSGRKKRGRASIRKSGRNSGRKAKEYPIERAEFFEERAAAEEKANLS